MARLTIPSVAVIISPIPHGAATAEVIALFGRAATDDAPVTWTTTYEMLPMVREAAKATPATVPPSIAIDLSDRWPTTRQSLRHELRSARAIWPALDTVVLHGPVALDHRDVLVQEGITTAGIDQFDAHPRGSRRPAPQGWRCRSIVWGLWEVAVGERPRRTIMDRVAAWRSHAGRAGRLTVLHAGNRDQKTSIAVIRSKLDRHRAWARRRADAGTVQTVRLSDLPSIIAGRDDTASRGSVLKAA